MNISIIIPTLNEELVLRRLIPHLLTVITEDDEIIIVDGGSMDQTLKIASEFNTVLLNCTASRAKQLNLGAKNAKNELLYFLHADTLPPSTFRADAMELWNSDNWAGTYRSRFDSSSILLRLNEFFTRFNWLVSRGGDQSLFISKSKFKEFGGYDEALVIMEEYPLLQTLMVGKKLKVFDGSILISTRKYEKNSWFKVQRANFIAFKMFKKGMKSEEIKKKYLELLH